MDRTVEEHGYIPFRSSRHGASFFLDVSLLLDSFRAFAAYETAATSYKDTPITGWNKTLQRSLSGKRTSKYKQLPFEIQDESRKAPKAGRRTIWTHRRTQSSSIEPSLQLCWFVKQTRCVGKAMFLQPTQILLLLIKLVFPLVGVTKASWLPIEGVIDSETNVFKTCTEDAITVTNIRFITQTMLDAVTVCWK